MKHLKLTFVGLLALTAAAGRIRLWPTGASPDGWWPAGPPNGRRPAGSPGRRWSAGGAPDGRRRTRRQHRGTRPPQEMPPGISRHAAPRGMPSGISRHAAPREMLSGISRQAPPEMSPGMSRHPVPRETSPAPEITMAATPSTTMVAETMARDMVADPMAADPMAADTMVMGTMVTDATGAHMRPEPRQERQPPRATGRQRPITIAPRHTTILVGTPITGATTPQLFRAPSDDAP
jgi:hypothetical protein